MSGESARLYARLPVADEAAVISAAVPAGGAVLELGCGAGRVTHALVALGHRVVAVDRAADMLAHVRGAETVLADIVGLDLGRRFAAVVLADNFVNTPDLRLRHELLATCARHVAADGVVLLQRLPPGWSPAVGRPAGIGGVGMRVTALHRHGREVWVRMQFDVEGRTWSHEFTARLLDDEELARAAGAVGLAVAGGADATGHWVRLVPAARRDDPRWSARAVSTSPVRATEKSTSQA